MDHKKNKNHLISIILFSLVVILYGNTINHQYAFDDSVAITGNKHTLKGLEGIPALLTEDLFHGLYDKPLEIGGGRYRPLSLVTFAIEVEIFDLNPTVSHVVNIILYGIIGILLFKMFLLWLPGFPTLAFISSIFFIAHPIHTEVVANIKSRDEILCLLFLLLSMIFFFKHLNRSNIILLLGSLFFYFLSLLSKENGITFLAIIPLSLFVFKKYSTRKSLISSWPFLLVAVGYIALRTSLVGFIGDQSSTDIMENPFVNASFSEKYATITYTLGKYLYLLIWPHPLSSDYSYNQIPITGWGNWKVLLSFSLILIALVYSMITIKARNVIAFSIAFFFITISIVSNIVFNIGAPLGERFAFLPSIGFCLLMSYLINLYVLKNPSGLSIKDLKLIGITLMILIPYSVKTITRNADWKNNIVLFSKDVDAAPNSAKVHYYYGNSMLQKALDMKASSEKVKALTISRNEFLRSLEINPDFHHSSYNMGLIYKEEGKIDSAIYFLEKVLSTHPTHIKSQSLLGTIYGRYKKDYPLALKYLKTAVEYDPNNAGTFKNLGIVYIMSGKNTQAVDAFLRAIQLTPKDAGNYLNLAIVYQSMGDKEKADQYFEEAFRLDPTLRQKNQ